MTSKETIFPKILPVILAGGSGTRLWPLSRKNSPKQFIKLIGDHSLFQETLLRTKDLINAPDLLVITNETHYFLCQDQIDALNFDGVKIILEPSGRNTAPAACVAAEYALKHYGKETLLLIFPADHLIKDPKTFQEVMEAACQIAAKGSLVTFGIQPTEPKTGYGYIQTGQRRDHLSYAVKQFVEKPDKTRAKSFLEEGNFFWNSGMFLFGANYFLMELKKYAPAICEAVKKTLAASQSNKKYLRLDSSSFEKCPSDSIDYAVMEKTSQAAIIPLDITWSDLGCWSSVAKAFQLSENDNVIQGKVIAEKTSGCFLSAEGGPLVATLGLKDHIVVSTKDAILVADKAYAQEVKSLVATLQQQEHQLVTSHPELRFSWGTEEELQKNKHSTVIRLELNPQSEKIANDFSYLIVIHGTVLVEDGEHTVLLKSEQFYQSTSPCKIINQEAFAAEMIQIVFSKKPQDKSALLEELLNTSLSLAK